MYICVFTAADVDTLTAVYIYIYMYIRRRRFKWQRLCIYSGANYNKFSSSKTLLITTEPLNFDMLKTQLKNMHLLIWRGQKTRLTILDITNRLQQPSDIAVLQRWARLLSTFHGIKCNLEAWPSSMLQGANCCENNPWVHFRVSSATLEHNSQVRLGVALDTLKRTQESRAKVALDTLKLTQG